MCGSVLSYGACSHRFHVNRLFKLIPIQLWVVLTLGHNLSGFHFSHHLIEIHQTIAARVHSDMGPSAGQGHSQEGYPNCM